MTFGPQKRNSPPYKTPAHQGLKYETPTSQCSSLPAAASTRDDIPSALQHQPRYARNDTPYKSLLYISRVLEDAGRRTIHAVRTPYEGMTKHPDTVIRAVLDSFRAQHGDAQPELDPHTISTIRENVPLVFNRNQQRAIEHTRFSILELQRVLDRPETWLCGASTDCLLKRSNASP